MLNWCEGCHGRKKKVFGLFLFHIFAHLKGPFPMSTSERRAKRAEHFHLAQHFQGGGQYKEFFICIGNFNLTNSQHFEKQSENVKYFIGPHLRPKASFFA
jgi:hypothetical protein